MENILRNQYGAIEFKYLSKCLKNVNNKYKLIKYDNEYYYLKPVKSLDYLYNELISYEIARDYNIKCCDTDIYVDDFGYGYISKKEISDYNYTSMYDLLLNTSYTSSLEDFWNYFDVFCSKSNTKKIMDEIINLFMYDILIGNSDRHRGNYGIIKNDDNISLAPIFDNEMLFSDYAFLDNYFSISVEKEDMYRDIGTFDSIDKFIKIGDSSYSNRLLSSLWIINKDNMLNIFNRIEEKIGCSMQPDIKKKILIKSEDYYRKLNMKLRR